MINIVDDVVHAHKLLDLFERHLASFSVLHLFSSYLAFLSVLYERAL